jgi:hypothetical protein
VKVRSASFVFCGEWYTQLYEILSYLSDATYWA